MVTEELPDVLFFDAAKEELFTVPRKPLPQELDDTRIVGTCHGWGFFSDNHDRSLHISDYLNPLSSKSDPKVTPLPPLTALYACQTELVCNVALSSSPCDDDGDEDCVVAVNFLGRQLSFCEARPNRDWRWTDFVAPFNLLESSNLMYSKRDRKFYLPVPGSNHLCSWDLHFKKDMDPKFHKYLFRNRPKLSQSEKELLDSCSREEHWVESPSGERFLVKCYYTRDSHQERDPVFMVFREDQTTDKEGTRIMCYTEDIGDMCIFISGTDPFCLDESLSLGLVSNSIYLMDPIIGVYDLATRNIPHFEENIEIEMVCLPYWLPPM